MLNKIDDPFEKLDPLLAALRRDPSSFEGWSALYLSVPFDAAGTAEKAETVLLDAADLMVAYLSMAEGFVCRPLPYAILIVCQGASRDHLIEAGAQATDLMTAQVDCPISYEIYALAREDEFFAGRMKARFGLDHVSPPPSWSSPNHLPRICRDGDQGHQALRETLARSCRVLLVEDDPVTRWLARNALREACDLMTASTAGKAMSLYRAYSPDLVLLDIGLPDQEGTAVLDDIMAHDPAAKVVMFTHSHDFDTLTETMARGAAGYITKPFHRARLLEYIR